jgi:hypothetical protein
MIKVWLDDIRPMPKEYDTHVKTAKEAIRLLASGQVEMISFDHDLGPAEAGTGYEVAKELERMVYDGLIKMPKWALHTANPVGRENMRKALLMAQLYGQKHREEKP